MSHRFKPLGDRVLVRPIPEPDVTPGGIVLVPGRERERVQRGLVIARGPGDKLPDGSFAPMCLNVGDTVLMPRRGGDDKVKIDGEELLVFHEEQFAWAMLEE